MSSVERTIPTGATPFAALHTAQLSAGYHGDPVVHDCNIRVDAGQVVCIIGPNGAGKSTLIKAIAGDVAVYAGDMYLGSVGLRLLDGDARARAGLGYVPQLDDVFPPLSVLENLEMGGYMLPKHSVKARVSEVLDRFPQLATKKRQVARTLSGGERKMLAIARSLMSRPSVLLLDEPAANLSHEVSEQFFNQQVRTLATEGVAVLIIEQKAHAALRSSDWAYVMVAGRIQISAPARDLADHQDLGLLFLSGNATLSKVESADADVRPTSGLVSP